MKSSKLALVLATLWLAGCGGGGGSNTTPATPAKAQSQSVRGSVVISIPVGTGKSTSSRVRYPQFVSPNASSVALSINGGADAFYDVSATSSLCTTVAGARNCTLSFGAPAGSDTFAFLVFSGPNGSGSQLASATSSQTIASGQPFNFTIALNAAIGTVVANVVGGAMGNCPGYINGNSNTINEGCPGFATGTFTVMDPSGAVVTGTAPYASPITITASDPSLSASPNTITAPGQTSTLTYNGAVFATNVTTSIIFDLNVSGVAIPVAVPVRRSYLYVANSNAPIGTTPAGGGNVAVYTFGASGGTPPTRLLTSLTTPTKAITDNVGNLYVLDNGIPTAGPAFNASIFVFAPGATGTAAPIRTIYNMNTITAQPCSDMVFDPTGAFLFVACGSQIQVFPITANGSASSVVSTEMTDDSAATMTGMAFDPSGSLYFSDDQFNAIFYVPPPVPTSGAFHYIGGSSSMQPPSSWPNTLDPGYMAIDAQTTLYAPFFYQNQSSGAPDTIAELGIWKSSTLPCTNCPPSASLTGSPFSTHAVTGVALDAADNVYVGNIFTNQITEFSAATISGASLGTTGAVLRTLNNTGAGQATGTLGLWVGP